MPRLLRKWGVPGAAVAVTDRSGTFFAEGYGMRDPRRRLPFTPQTNICVCSCTKAMTGAAVAMLADDGRIEWDRPLRDFVPSFRMHDPVLTERVTVRDLLSHRTGVPGNDSAWIFSSRTRSELAECLRHLPPNRDLRTAYQYNNLQYSLVGWAVERITGVPWEEFLRERLFAPAGMRTSQFSGDTDPASSETAVGHMTAKLIPSYLFGAPRRESSFAAAMGAIGPAGGAVSNALDMCRWLRVHLNDGEAPAVGEKRVRVISARNLAEMHAPAIPMTGALSRECAEVPYLQQAAGLVVAPYRGHRCIFHTGCFAGFKSMQMFLPDAGFATAVLLNSDNSMLESIIPNMVNDLLLGLPPVDWDARWREVMKSWGTAGPEPEKPRRGTKPSHPPKDYAGRFVNPAYGAITVGEKAGGLVVGFKGFTLRTRHRHYDVFETVPDRRGIPFGGFKVRFNTAEDGRVDSLTAAFFMAGETVFRRD